MELSFLSFVARNQALRAPGNAPLPGKRLLAIAERGTPARAGIPQRRQQNFGGIGGTIQRLNRALYAYPAVGHCPFVVPAESAKKREGRFLSGSSGSSCENIPFCPCDGPEYRYVSGHSSGHSAAWLARPSGGREVESSNLSGPTNTEAARLACALRAVAF